MRNSNPLRSILSSFGPQCYPILTTIRSKSSKSGDPISFTPLEKISDESGLLKINETIAHVNKHIIPSQSKKITYFTNDDIGEESEYSPIIIGSVDDIAVHYGQEGIMPREHQTQQDMLTDTFNIQGGQIGILDVKRQVPLKLDMSERSVAISLGELKNYPTHKENITRCSLYPLNDHPLPDKVSKSVTAKLRDRIHSDLDNEYFGNEITLPVYKPNESNKSSATLMDFDERGTGLQASDTHYHPGERVLYIFTTDKPSGVSINLCGIKENPEDRKDCEINYEFPLNSIIILKFPSLAWHNFNGDFVCISNHSREGDNFIKAVQEGSLDKEFLASATTFIEEKDNKDQKWQQGDLGAHQKENPDKNKPGFGR